MDRAKLESFKLKVIFALNCEMTLVIFILSNVLAIFFLSIEIVEIGIINLMA